MIVGSVPLNAPASKVREFYIQRYMNVNVAGMTSAYSAFVGSFTMPFTGSVMVNAWAKFHVATGHDSFIVVTGNGVNGTPPTNAPPGVWQDGLINTYSCIIDVPYSFYFNSIASGQVVNIWSAVSTAVWNPYWEWNLCLARAIRA
jgi:hypothetical protein